MTELTLPYPPSVNTYWRHLSRGPLAGRTLISEKGRAYRAEVMRRCYGLRLCDLKLAGRLGITIHAHAPDRRVRDLDNILKSLLDSLTHAGVIEDDSQFDVIQVFRGEVTRGGVVQVSVGQIEPTKKGYKRSQQRRRPLIRARAALLQSALDLLE